MKKKPTVVFLHPHFTLPGGAGKFVLRVGQLLAERGWTVVVISMRAKKEFRQQAPLVIFEDVGGPITSSFIFWIFFPYYYLKMAALINKYKDGILFPQVFPANWWGFVYKLLHPSVKLIWMCQEPSAFIHSKAWRHSITNPVKRLLAEMLQPALKIIDVRLSRNVDLVFANSRYSLNEIQRIYNYDSAKIRVIYMGIDKIKHTPVNRRLPVIITVSRLTKFKRVDIIIEAFAKLCKLTANHRYKLVIVGDGEEKENLEQRVAKLNLMDRVVFTGKIDDLELHNFLASAQLFVTAAVNEPFGIAVIEALAAGLPVIAHNSGGPAETVTSSTGLLLSHLNSDTLAEAMLSLLNSGGIKHMRKAARESASNYSWEKVVSEVEEVLYVD